MTEAYVPGIVQYSAAMAFVNSSDRIRKEFEQWHLENHVCYRCGDHSNCLRMTEFAGGLHLCCPDCVSDLSGSK